MKKMIVLAVLALLLSSVAFGQITYQLTPPENVSPESLESTGYIVTFNLVSVADKYNELAAENQRNINKYKAMFFLNPVKWYYGLFVIKSDSKINKEVKAYQEDLDQEYNGYIEDIKQDLSLSDDNIGTRFKDGTVGVTLYITQNEAKTVKDKPYVNSLLPNLVLKAEMKDVPNMLGLDNVWNLVDPEGENLDGTGVRIGIIDSGFDLFNPYLSDVDPVDAHCFCAIDSTLSPCCPNGEAEMDGLGSLEDGYSHGTHVLGILASNSEIYKGIAPKAEFMLVKASGNKYQDGFPLESIMAGIDYLMDPNGDGDYSDRAQIISISVGMSPKKIYEDNYYKLEEFCDLDDNGERDHSCSEQDVKDWMINELFQPMFDQIETYTQTGTLFVIAAGNDGKVGSGYLSAFGMMDQPLIVGAVDKEGNLAPYSSTGPAYNGFSGLDILAPGGCTDSCLDADQFIQYMNDNDVEAAQQMLRDNAQQGIMSTKSMDDVCAVMWGTDCVDEFYTMDEGRIVSYQGTSMAAPMVAGVAALVLQKHPDATPSQLQEAIKETATPMSGGADEVGSGMIAPEAAVEYNFECPDADTMTDPENCGSCGNICGGEYQCVEGVCEFCGDGVCNGLEDTESCSEDCGTPSEVCDNGIDDDGDNAIDCADEDCNGMFCDGENNVCSDGVCGTQECVPDCSASECGDDGCGGLCGECTGDDVCSSGQCVTATTIGKIKVTCSDGTCTSYTLPEIPSECDNATYEVWKADIYSEGYSDEGGVLITDIEGTGSFYVNASQ